ncbi:adenosine kinase [Chitinivorax tropicus]|uniref:Adenosine kinase n=1 Tax=Chitinivorax tropicus TaxID=714531 RepID=A0A840MN38_9PROT|nr:carbohydrate kinase family protein [Chitinivorax tropicus]MBB5018162.1 adenosine kinase [Chitinivorax tropicus]
MNALICGSMAFDTIMVFQDRFRHHILPEKVHMLSVSFLVPEMRREFGGTAGNIAYNLKLLGGEPLIMATVGDDFAPYQIRLETLGIPQTHVHRIHGSFTAQAFITTDLDDNQITAFHPGAMAESHLNHVADAKAVDIGIIAPDGRQGMIQHAQEFKDAGIPFIFDPGQGLPLFNGEELLSFIELADYMAVNDYEAQLLQERTGLTLSELATRVKALVVTRGADGSDIYTEDRVVKIPSVPATAVVDPTGCGDAYRAGLIYGIEHEWSWEKTGRLASLLGSLKIACRGPQNHTFDRDSLATAYQAAFNEALW